MRDYFWVNCWPETWTEKQTFQKHFSKDFTQKQPPEVFYKRSWSKKFCNIHRKTPALEFLNKVADLKACNFVKKRLQHSLSLWNIAEYSRTTYFEEHQHPAASVDQTLIDWLLLFSEPIVRSCSELTDWVRVPVAVT